MHLQFITMVSLLVSNPSNVHCPLLTQAHTSTVGLKVEAAPLESVATNTKLSVVMSCKVHMNLCSPSLPMRRKESGGNPPCTLKVKVSPGSVTVRVYTDLSPTLTLNTASADMLGGKFAVKGIEKHVTCI